MNAVVKPRLEVAFGALPLAANPTWTDLTSRLRSASANSQLGQEGTCDLVLDNRDRALEPEYSGSPYYPNVVPNLRMRLVAGSNLLDYETSTGEGGFGGVVGWNAVAPNPWVIGRFYDEADSSGFTITGNAANGTAVPTLTFGGSAYSTADIATAAPVVAGQTYTAIGQFKPVATARPVATTIDWYTSAGALIGSVAGGSGTETLGQWTQVTATVTAPALAAFVKVRFIIQHNAVPTGEVHRIRNLGVFPGTVTTWTPGWTIPFDGYVDKVIPGYVFGPAGGGDAVVTVRCTDLTKILARYPVRPPYDVEVKADNPTHWWPLGETKGSLVMGDSGSDPAPGRWLVAAELGEGPATVGSSATALKVATGQSMLDYWGLANITPLPSPWTIETVIAEHRGSDTFGSGTSRPILAILCESPNDSIRVEVAAGFIRLSIYENGVEFLVPSFDGAPLTAYPAHVAIVKSSSTVTFYLNGVSVGSYGSARTLSLINARVGLTIPSAFSEGSMVRFSHVSYTASALSAARVLAHADAARIPWAGDSTGSRVARLCAAIGIPSIQQDIDTGKTTGLSAQIDPVEGTTALDLARKAEETEFARQFASAGKWTFRDRRSLDGTTPVATFGDAGDGVEIPYSGLVEDFSEDHIVRTATVTRQGGNPQTYTDPAATSADAVFGEPRDGLLYGTDVEAHDAAAYLVLQNKTPRLRFEAVTLQGERSQAVMRQVAARKIGDKVTVRRRPPGGGAPQEKTVVIEGVTHDINLQAPTWRTTYKLAPADTADYWKLEDAVLGQLDSTTVLAF